MKKNKITRCKVWFAAALLMFVAVMAPMSSYAAGEYTVSGTFKKGLSGVNFELYKVGQFEGSNLKLNFSAPVDLTIKKEDFGTDKDWEKAWLDQAAIVKNYLPKGSTAAGKGTTDANGAFTISPKVGNGLYLLLSNDDPKTMKEGNTTYAWSPQPMLILVFDEDVAVMIKPTSEPVSKKYCVMKTWSDTGYQSSRPSSVTVDIYWNYKAGQTNTPEMTVTLNQSNNWTYSWETDKTDGTYTAVERQDSNIQGKYTVSVNNNASTKADTTTINVTNTYKPPTTPTTPTKPSVKTGDQGINKIYYVLAGAALLVLIIWFVVRRRGKEQA